jgi:hypothetical protein
MSENLGIVLHQAIRENDCVLAATSRMRGPKIPTSTGLSRVLLLRLYILLNKFYPKTWRENMFRKMQCSL